MNIPDVATSGQAETPEERLSRIDYLASNLLSGQDCDGVDEPSNRSFVWEILAIARGLEPGQVGDWWFEESSKVALPSQEERR